VGPGMTTDSSGNPPAFSRDTVERIRRVFVKALRLNVDLQDLPYADTLDEMAGLDSVAILEFVLALEDEFGVAIEAQFLQFDLLRDLSRLATYIEERMIHDRADS
jgi:acyl carrier protein